MAGVSLSPDINTDFDHHLRIRVSLWGSRSQQGHDSSCQSTKIGDWMGPQGLEEEPHFAPEWPCLAPRQTPRHRISPVGKMRAREQGQVLIFQCTPLSPCPGHWGHLRGCGWGEARSTAPRARILQGTWVLLTTWRPHQGAQTIADTVLVVLLTPGPLISSTPLPRASSLCRAP